MRKLIGLLLAACVLLVTACARPEPLSPEEREAKELEKQNSLYPGGMDSRLPAPRRFPGLEPGEEPPVTQRSALEARSMGVIIRIANEIERLKPRYPELQGFSDDCIEDDGLALHYSRNLVQGELDTTLGDGPACEIMIEFSPIIDRGLSFIPWESYTVVYPRLGWQACSYPASYWLRTADGSLQFGGRFVRSYNPDLCSDVTRIVNRNLRHIEELDAAAVRTRSADTQDEPPVEKRLLKTDQ